MSVNRIEIDGLKIAKPLYELVRDEIAPGTWIDADHIWRSLARIVRELTPRNQALLARRDELQARLNEWHTAHPGPLQELADYRRFLEEIGYLLPDVGTVQVDTRHVDPEIAQVAGPQLVVPVNNARYAINACNARWGNLFDALYGTDVIPDEGEWARGEAFNPKRFEKVLEHSYQLLDQAVPLAGGSHADVETYSINDDGVLEAKLLSGQTVGLVRVEQFTAYHIDADSEALMCILLVNHGLHIELQFDRDYYLGKLNPAGIKYIFLEAAISTIQDCEDSVAAVDAEDKVLVYRNWLGLMKGELKISFSKHGQNLDRSLEPDRHYTAAQGGELILPGRSLMLIRNVGHHMTNDAVLDEKGEPIYEGLLDALITSFCAVHDLRGKGRYRNSRSGSIYIVKPKMHGPEEVAFTADLFSRVEDALALARNTLKLGIMDEERRTTLNLKQCIAAARERVIFINTGFLDRTGDEIHSCMEAGPVLRKKDLKTAGWLMTYEDWNVDVGLSCGLRGRAQIGKGMWTQPNEMHAMLANKAAHPRAGASCAWVPSPTAAVLHAMHYHEVHVHAVQGELAKRQHARLDELLQYPVTTADTWSEQAIHEELENNLHAILGYVVRWVDQGIGCSTVPDIDHIGLMEDRATLRIASQLVGNWLHHGVVSEQQVDAVLQEMAQLVDEQNAADQHYKNMAPGFDGAAFMAARELVMQARSVPNGYTESTLHHWRRQAKSDV